MQRHEYSSSVVYTSTGVAEVQLMQMILKFKGIDASFGASTEGHTLVLTTQEAEKFEKEAREWLVACTGICSSFAV